VLEKVDREHVDAKCEEERRGVGCGERFLEDGGEVEGVSKGREVGGIVS